MPCPRACDKIHFFLHSISLRMSNKGYNKRLTSQVQSKFAALLQQESGLSPKAAMARVTEEMLENNPFVPPKGEKCPIDSLPDEILVYIFETGIKTAMEPYIKYEDNTGDEDEDEDTEGTQDDTQMKIEEIDDEDDSEWSDVDEEESKREGKKIDDDDDDGDDDDDDDMEDEEEEPELPFQVLISHVCKRWRSVALDTPILWTHLHFEKGTSLDRHQAYIERAKNAPLEIIIDCANESDTEDGDEDVSNYATNPVLQARDRELVDCLRNSIDRSDPSLPNLFNDPDWHTKPGRDGYENNSTELHDYTISELSEILDLVTPRVQQWRTLSVSVHDYRWMYLLLARLHQCPPAEILEVLELYVHDNDEEEISFHPRDLIARFTLFQGQAPHLAHCVFWGVHLDWDASLGMLENLKELELAYHVEEVRPSYQMFEAILKSTNLQALLLSLSGPAGTEDDWRHAGYNIIQLPSLEELILRYHPLQYVCSLLRFIDTPNLRSLGLDFVDDDYTKLAQDLCKAPFGRSKTLLAGLEHLKLSGLPCDATAMKKILDELTELKSLDLNCLGQPLEIFEKIEAATKSIPSLPVGSQKPYCPTLESIATVGITGRRMKQFIEARKEAGVPVQRVMMSEYDDIDDRSEKWLKRNTKEFVLFNPSDSEEEVFDVFDPSDSDELLAHVFAVTDDEDVEEEMDEDF